MATILDRTRATMLDNYAGPLAGTSKVPHWIVEFNRDTQLHYIEVGAPHNIPNLLIAGPLILDWVYLAYVGTSYMDFFDGDEYIMSTDSSMGSLDALTFDMGSMKLNVGLGIECDGAAQMGIGYR